MLHAHHRKPLLVALTLLCWLPFDAAWATPAPLSSHTNRFLGLARRSARQADLPRQTPRRRPYCRDGRHHIPHQRVAPHVFTNRIKGMGGGYVGVGADQQLTFVAAARAELAWLLDYDPTVVALNRVHKQLILAADSPAAFIELWSKKSKPRVAAILKSASGLSAADRKLLQSTYTSTRRWLQRFFRRVWNSRKHERYHWLHDPAGYAHIKAMLPPAASASWGVICSRTERWWASAKPHEGSAFPSAWFTYRMPRNTGATRSNIAPTSAASISTSAPSCCAAAPQKGRTHRSLQICDAKRAGLSKRVVAPTSTASGH
jgi:hypothetical protein